MAAPQSTPLPEAPQRGEPESVFIPKSNAFVASLEPFRQDMQSVADYVALVESISAEIETVSGIAGNVTTVAGISGNVTAVANNASNINTVAGNNANITTVAGVSADVSELAPYASDIPVANAQADDISAAAALARRQALYSRSVALNPPVAGETLRLDYANRAYGIGDAETGLVDDIQPFAGAHLFTRGSTKWAPNALGVLTEYGIDEPAYTYDPVTGKPLGLLIEEQRTNLLLWSEDFTQSVWSLSNTSVQSTSEGFEVSVASSASGNFNRVHQSFAAATGRHVGYFICARGNQPYITVAIFEDTTSSTLARAVYNFDTDELTLPLGAGLKSKRLHDGLVMIWLEVDKVFTDCQISIYPGLYNNQNIGDSVVLLRAQLEQGSTPSSYIPTTTAQVTRAADNCSRTLGAEWNNDEFTVYAEFDWDGSGSRNKYLCSLSQGGVNDRIRTALRLSEPSSRCDLIVSDGPISLPSPAVNAPAVIGRNRFAVSYKDGEFAIVANGAGATRTATNTYATADTLTIGSLPQGQSVWNDGIPSVIILPRALPLEELQALTTPEA